MKTTYKKGEKQLAILMECESKGGMTYTEIIKMAYEMSYGRGSFDKVENRGYWSGAFVVKNSGYFYGPKRSGWIAILMDKVDGKYVVNGDGMKQIQISLDKFSN